MGQNLATTPCQSFINWQQSINSDIFTNLVTNEQIHRHYIHLQNPEDLSYYSMRMQEHYIHVIRVIYYHPAPDNHFDGPPKTFFVYTERKLPLTQWRRDTSFAIMKGFRRLFANYQPFRVDQSMIGQNEKGVVKVWVHSNPIVNLPFLPLLKQQQMLSDVALIIKYHDRQSASLLMGCRNFSEAIRRISEKLQEQKFTIHEDKQIKFSQEENLKKEFAYQDYKNSNDFWTIRSPNNHKNFISQRRNKPQLPHYQSYKPIISNSAKNSHSNSRHKNNIQPNCNPFKIQNTNQLELQRKQIIDLSNVNSMITKNNGYYPGSQDKNKQHKYLNSPTRKSPNYHLWEKVNNFQSFQNYTRIKKRKKVTNSNRKANQTQVEKQKVNYNPLNCEQNYDFIIEDEDQSKSKLPSFIPKKRQSFDSKNSKNETKREFDSTDKSQFYKLSEAKKLNQLQKIEEQFLKKLYKGNKQNHKKQSYNQGIINSDLQGHVRYASNNLPNHKDIPHDMTKSQGKQVNKDILQAPTKDQSNQGLSSAGEEPEFYRKQKSNEMAKLKREFGQILSWNNEEVTLPEQIKQNECSKNQFMGQKKFNYQTKFIEQISDQGDQTKERLIRQKVEMKKANFAELKNQAMKILFDSIV